jgi:hypothetical protein
VSHRSRAIGRCTWSRTQSCQKELTKGENITYAKGGGTWLADGLACSPPSLYHLILYRGLAQIKEELLYHSGRHSIT